MSSQQDNERTQEVAPAQGPSSTPTPYQHQHQDTMPAHLQATHIEYSQNPFSRTALEHLSRHEPPNVAMNNFETANTPAAFPVAPYQHQQYSPGPAQGPTVTFCPGIPLTPVLQFIPYEYYYDFMHKDYHNAPVLKSENCAFCGDAINHAPHNKGQSWYQCPGRCYFCKNFRQEGEIFCRCLYSSRPKFCKTFRWVRAKPSPSYIRHRPTEEEHDLLLHHGFVQGAWKSSQPPQFTGRGLQCMQELEAFQQMPCAQPGYDIRTLTRGNTFAHGQKRKADDSPTLQQPARQHFRQSQPEYGYRQPTSADRPQIPAREPSRNPPPRFAPQDHPPPPSSSFNPYLQPNRAMSPWPTQPVPPASNYHPQPSYAYHNPPSTWSQPSPSRPVPVQPAPPASNYHPQPSYAQTYHNHPSMSSRPAPMQPTPSASNFHSHPSYIQTHHNQPSTWSQAQPSQPAPMQPAPPASNFYLHPSYAQTRRNQPSTWSLAAMSRPSHSIAPYHPPDAMPSKIISDETVSRKEQRVYNPQVALRSFQPLLSRMINPDDTQRSPFELPAPIKIEHETSNQSHHDDGTPVPVPRNYHPIVPHETRYDDGTSVPVLKTERPIIPGETHYDGGTLVPSQRNNPRNNDDLYDGP